ncbi:hypothetical protein LT330_003648 [Penicillium expansum]|uniref:Peptidase S15/CocE/NonD, C-terminal n=1 Tax=Penicillium expansum TaxID=27334 RepID=A0A0A2JM81_PENEN|nr:Peptidase S15/CocE/NonD, C-terminal [Penicillium expansum]KAK4861613.1 hypothetical protein LT330_003648 [Penicillium expansum]KGO46758.1 Peptidase S15/CocE/NonD, C-terminal [Penicillium expansum]KGO53390.1 Peptidase S15/CocE/NonD, C-terminal [Penicillium expansum]KGO72266.1 Peptidase S15/CocE/NonD, C-terminal [Penicillium expansum]
MPNPIRDIQTIDNTHPYIIYQNVSVPLRIGGVIRCNLYLPRGVTEGGRYPVVATYGPYGKDVPYKDFKISSFQDLNPEHQTEHSSWETPTPSYWTRHGYAVLRADELGTGQSPGPLNQLSSTTFDAYQELIEWAAQQKWSTGKVGLLGVSYYALTQWQVAARQPKGLACMIPWEGLSDYYRDGERHGGILSSNFLRIWYNRQVKTNQYGRPGREAEKRGPDTVDGDLTQAELLANEWNAPDDSEQPRFRDDERWASINYNLEDVKVPFLSVANLGGIGLHLRGNVEGFTHAGSKLKYLRFIVGRHDLPFYYTESVELQRSFLDAFLKSDDRVGWSTGKLPAVDLVLRKGDVGVNNAEAELTFPRRSENEWPIARTKYTPIFLTPDNQMTFEKPSAELSKLSYRALGTLKSPELLTFTTPPFTTETEITGHIVTHLNVSVTRDAGCPPPSEIDLFLTLRHISATGKEIFYTGSSGEGVPVTRGWLRVSMRATKPDHPRHRAWLPYRGYYSTDVLPVIPGDIYSVDVEIWPTNVVVEKGGQLVLEVSSGDTRNSSIFQHTHPLDRPASKLQGTNHVHFGPNYVNYMSLPIIPSRD